MPCKTYGFIESAYAKKQINASQAAVNVYGSDITQSWSIVPRLTHVTDVTIDASDHQSEKREYRRARHDREVVSSHLGPRAPRKPAQLH